MNFPTNKYGGYIVPANTVFAARLSFPDNSEFGDCCVFGDWCKFGEYSVFGFNTIFGNHCEFQKVVLGKTFARDTYFGDRCVFDGVTTTSTPIKWILGSKRIIKPNLNEFIS